MKATVLSLLSCIFVMLFTQRFRLYMFCLFPLSEPYNLPSWWTRTLVVAFSGLTTGKCGRNHSDGGFGSSSGTCLIYRLLKSGRPLISPGGVQNEKIENPQTLSEYRSRQTISRKITFRSIGFLFYAYDDRVGSEALRQVFKGSRPYIT